MKSIFLLLLTLSPVTTIAASVSMHCSAVNGPRFQYNRLMERSVSYSASASELEEATIPGCKEKIVEKRQIQKKTSFHVLYLAGRENGLCRYMDPQNPGSILACAAQR